MAMVITQDPFLPLSSWPGRKEKGWNHSALNTASTGFLPWPYVNHEIFLFMLAKGLLMW